MDYEKLLEQVERTVTPPLSHLGLELIEREFVLDQGRWILRLYIDREGVPVTIDDCEKASRAMEGPLDVENIIPQRYVLEVSSPGLNRPLRRPKDFERFAGEAVEINLKNSVEGRHHFSGLLKGLSEGKVILLQDKREWLLPLEAIKKARLKSTLVR